MEKTRALFGTKQEHIFGWLSSDLLAAVSLPDVRNRCRSACSVLLFLFSETGIGEYQWVGPDLLLSRAHTREDRAAELVSAALSFRYPPYWAAAASGWVAATAGRCARRKVRT